MSVASTIWTRVAPARRRQAISTGTLRRTFRQARECWVPLSAICLLSLISTPLALLLPWPLKIAVDNVLGGQALPSWLRPVAPSDSRGATLGVAIGLLLGVSLLIHLQALASWLLQTYTGEKLVLGFRVRLFCHAQRLSLRFHERKGSNDIAYRIQHDAPAIQYVTLQGVLPFGSAIVSFAGMTLVTARIDRAMAMLALAISPLLFLLARSSSRRVHDRWHEVKELDSSAMAVLQEVLTSVRVVKAFGREQREDERFVERASRRMWSQVKLALVQASFHVMMGLLVAVGTAAALFIGVQHVRGGRLTLGELLIVMSYIAQLYEPLKTISSKIPELQAWLVSLERAFALLDETPELYESPSARPLKRASGAIRFENVSFSYGEDAPVLKEISFEIPAGSRVGIVGATGSGKTTLISLMSRFYDVDSGRILLDGVDVREYRLADLRSQFSVVLQEPVLFSSSVTENIAFAKPEASNAEILAAARAANAHGFIKSLPSGYRTQVGDRGSLLSGGQRQRISLARAFLKDSPFLVLDEPTSSVDVKTEDAIITATDELMRGRTTFMIAHRMSTLRCCDILLMVGPEGMVTVEKVDATLAGLMGERGL